MMLCRAWCERAEVGRKLAQAALELPALFHGGNDRDFQRRDDRRLRGKGLAHGVAGGQRFAGGLDQPAGIAARGGRQLVQRGGEGNAGADELRQAVVEALLLPKGE